MPDLHASRGCAWSAAALTCRPANMTVLSRRAPRRALPTSCAGGGRTRAIPGIRMASRSAGCNASGGRTLAGASVRRSSSATSRCSTELRQSDPVSGRIRGPAVRLARLTTFRDAQRHRAPQHHHPADAGEGTLLLADARAGTVFPGGLIEALALPFMPVAFTWSFPPVRGPRGRLSAALYAQRPAA